MCVPNDHAHWALSDYEYRKAMERMAMDGMIGPIEAFRAAGEMIAQSTKRLTPEATADVHRVLDELERRAVQPVAV